MHTSIYPRGRRNANGLANPLVRLEGRAALSVDRTGVITAATGEAARLFDRPLDYLIGFPLGQLPPHPIRTELELVRTNGDRRTIMAWIAEEAEDRSDHLVLMAESPGGIRLDLAVSDALEAARETLASAGVEARIHRPRPAVRVVPETHSLTIEAVSCLLRLATVSPGACLDVELSVDGGVLATIGLGLDGATFRRAVDHGAHFDRLLAPVHAAGGFLVLEVGDRSLGLKLAMPLAYPAQSF